MMCSAQDAGNVLVRGAELFLQVIKKQHVWVSGYTVMSAMNIRFGVMAIGLILIKVDRTP
jgi:hypothetical protein